MNVLRAALPIAGLAALAACELPTEAPIIDQRWVIPLDDATLSVSQLLPSGVAVTGNAFSVSVNPFSTHRTLGELCATCGPLHGATAPVPGFAGNFALSQSLPADVSQATLTAGSVALAVHNGFSFDPMAGGGTVTVTLTDGTGGPVLGQTVFSGSLPPGQARSQAITLNPGSVGATLAAAVVVNSPGGQVTTIDSGQRLTVTATPSGIRASSARVNAAGRSISFDPTDLDVEDIDSFITDRIENGAIVLAITNPFAVAVSASVQIVYPGGTLAKPLAIGSAATSSATLSYTGEELRSFLGKPNVRLTGTGAVSPTAAPVTVTPGQQVVITTKLDLTLRVGGQP